VIRLALRLTVAGGREAATRLALIVVAVAVGVGLLLATLAGLNAVQKQNARYAWLETGFTGPNAPAAAASSDAALWWRLRADQFHGKVIGRVDVAATGSAAPVPPGIAKLPGPGEYYASPALADLLHDTPATQLGDRYPGHLVGTIGTSALPSPDMLIIIVGRSVPALAHSDGARLVDRISTTVPSSCNGDCALGVGTNSNGITLIFSVVAAALLFPVLVLIGIATRLSAARREQRFAAMRLVGATPRQVASISTVESAVAAVIGVVAGFVLFYAVRPAIAMIPFTGDRFFTSDVSPTSRDVVLVALGIPVVAAVAARFALRRVNISPLGVTRRVTPRPPRVWRVIPLLAGVSELSYFAFFHDIGANSRTDPTVEAVAFLAGVLLMMGGLVIAGPWLTMLVSRLVVRQANRPSTLIAARRLADNPRAGFRAISGLVLAVFVGACATGIIGTIVANSAGPPSVSGAYSGTLLDSLWSPDAAHAITSVKGGLVADLRSSPGVSGVLVVHDQELSLPGMRPGETAIRQLVSCAELTGVPAVGRCAPGAQAASIMIDFGGGLNDRKPMSERTWFQPPGVTLDKLGRLPVDSVVVGTDGSDAAIERARTVLDAAYPSTYAALTIGEIQANDNRLLTDYRRLAEVVILASLPIAACSLAVSIAGGLIERKRPFSLLRLTGAPLSMLRRVIGLEAAAPMLLTAVASVGAGLLAAYLFLRAQLGETLQAPGWGLYLYIGTGLVVSLAVIASTLPLLNRLTGPEVARNE
jgi:hypothetical protein